MLAVVIVCVIVALVAVFSVQNAAPVSVSFLMWRFEASLAVIIILSVLAGMIAGIVLLFWSRFRRQQRQKSAIDGERPVTEIRK
jgi:putative membrane protein